ncbi:MAG TPA: MBL fold metallo-hydrolase [Polyangia bacterium]|nr:MBL fold metallo-hydrolase [Polyangia bacterium]
MTSKTKVLLLASLPSALVVTAAVAQMGDASKVELKTTPVVGSVSVIEGANGFSGGNIGVSIGDDGVLLIDDGLAGVGPKLKARVAALSPKPIRFVLNTHWHGDHTGGNVFFGGTGPLLVAQDNVRKRLSTEQVMEFGGKKMTIPPLPAAALPAITFGEDATIHFNGDDVHALHMPPAHTDGDVIVHFAKANVIHAGDVFINQGHPIVDFGHGGKFQGLIDSASKIIALCDDKTRVIPGHGPVGGKADVEAWKKTLEQMRDRIAKLIKAKKTLEQIKAAKPLAEWERLDNAFIKSDMVVEMIYRSLSAK